MQSLEIPFFHLSLSVCRSKNIEWIDRLKMRFSFAASNRFSSSVGHGGGLLYSHKVGLLPGGLRFDSSRLQSFQKDSFLESKSN